MNNHDGRKGRYTSPTSLRECLHLWEVEQRTDWYGFAEVAPAAISSLRQRLDALEPSRTGSRPDDVRRVSS